MSVTTTGVTELTYDTEAGEWPITKTTVYNDQAEVRRSLSFKPVVSGSTLVKLRGLPSTINVASIRADIPSKNARLVEVFNDKTWEAGKPDEKIGERIEQLQVELKGLKFDLERATFRRDTVNQHQKAVLAGLAPSAVEDVQCALEPDLFGSISVALDTYDKLRTQMKKELIDLNAKKAAVEKEMGELNEKQNKLSQGKHIYSVHILLDIPEKVVKKSKKLVYVDLFYLVAGASWTASYDIRVEKGTDKVSLTYYGGVVNATKEDWVEVEMSLSTAKPSVGGALPPLARKQVDFEAVYQQTHQHLNKTKANEKKRPRKKNKKQTRGKMTSKISAAPNDPDGLLDSLTGEMPPFAALVNNAIASGDAGSTLFKITRLANIDSDRKPHRQTIAIVEFDASFTHVASPKISRNIFLKVSTRNVSDYPLLPGVLGVFIDGSFVSNSELKLVRANEDFSLFLGIDDSVKLNYGPEVVKKKTVNGGGLMKSSKRWHKTVLRDISVINNSPNDINLCIYEQLPFSKDGKVKIQLKQPAELKKTGEVTSLINAFNNLEAKTKLQARKRFNMPFEYSLEWPEGQELDIKQMKGE